MDALPPHSIAAEFNAMVKDKTLEVEGVLVPVDGVGCFDLAAARGIRGGRGRCACHCACLTAAHRHSIPTCLETDNDGLRELDWDTQLEPELKAHELLDNKTMTDDSHTPPDDWDYVAAPWACPREGCNVSFVSKEHYHVQRAIVIVMNKDKSTEGKKARAARAAAYLKLHPSNQEEFHPPLTLLDMIKILIDPLHAGLLNLPKTIWKYSFGDRMTFEQRELVAEYLEMIGCPLDIRAKGDGRDANRKWFMGDVFQRFVEGETDKSNTKNPGLMANITAILDIIYVKCPDTTAVAKSPPLTANPPPTAVQQNKTAKAGGGGKNKRAGGFSMAPPAAAPPPPAPDAPPPPPMKESERLAALRTRYGSHMDSARLALDAWAAFALLYVEWRGAWASRTVEYKKQRALAFAKCAAKVSTTMKDLSIGKQKSWYVHLVMWVIPLQMAEVGDMWAFSTGPLEQRGARLKRIAREVVSWRPPDDGFVADDAMSDGRRFVARRKYDTCAMMQLLRSCVAQEEEWKLACVGGCNLSVSERRFLQRGRVSLIKSDPGRRLPSVKEEAEEIIDLT